MRNASDWTAKRRPELLRLFEEHVYGRSPGRPSAPRALVVETDARALGGLATRRQVRVLLDGTDERRRLSRSFSTCRTRRPDRCRSSSASTSAATTRSIATRPSGSPPPGSPTAPASRLTARPRPRAARTPPPGRWNGSSTAATRWPPSTMATSSPTAPTVGRKGVRARIGPGTNGVFRSRTTGGPSGPGPGASAAPSTTCRPTSTWTHAGSRSSVTRASERRRSGRARRTSASRWSCPTSRGKAGRPWRGASSASERRTSRASFPTGSAAATARTPDARKRSPWTSTSFWPSSHRAPSTSRARPRTSGPTREASSWPQRRPSPSSGSWEPVG